MAEQEELLIEIRAETQQFVRGLADAKNGLTTFGQEGTVTINNLNTALRALQQAGRDSVDVSRIKAAGEAYRNLEQVGGRLRAVFEGLSNDGKSYIQSLGGINAELSEFRRLAQLETDPGKLRELGRLAGEAENRIRGLNEAFDEGRRSADTSGQSISGLSRRLQEIRLAAERSTDPVAIRQFGQEARILEGQIADLRAGFNGLDASTRRSRIAVYGLNQVVRDAPFGFIAISNNIPILIDQLAALRSTTGSVGATIKAFGRGLLSFGGISIALSAGISLITSAVQKYGSLSNAFAELTGSLTAAEKVQRDYNKALADGQADVEKQITRLNLLKTLSDDATIGIDNQKYATSLLRDEVDKIIVSQDLQKDGIEAVNGELLDYAKKVLIARSQLAAFDKVIGDIQVEFAKASAEGVTFADNIIAAFNKISTFVTALTNGQITLAAEIAKVDFAAIAYKRYQDRLEEITKKQNEARKAQEKFSQDTIRNGIKAIDLFNQQIQEQKKKTEEEKDSARESELARRKAIRDQERLNQEIRKSAEEFAAFRALFDQPIPIIAIDSIGLFREGLAKAKADLQRFGATAIPGTLGASFTKLINDIENLKRIGQQNLFDISTPVGNTDAVKRAQESIKRIIKETSDASGVFLDRFLEQSQTVANIFNASLGPAIDSIFSAIENGQNVIDALGQSFKRLVIDLIAVVAKAAALALIISLIPGGPGLAGFGGIFKGILSGGGGVGTRRGPLGGLLGGGLGGVAAPSLSGPGGIALSGEVVFVQRGTDLVGVLNRGNARIGRVG